MPTARERWVADTRASTARALRAAAGVPMSAVALEGDLDIGDYVLGIGFFGVRSQREISAALRWLVAEGYAEPVMERTKYDPPGKLYRLTEQGYEFTNQRTQT